MGRRDQFEKKTNPAEVTLEWAGDRDDGFFYYYDKDAKKKQPIRELSFVALGERVGISGYSQSMKTGLYSNEVGSTENQILTVKYYKDGKAHELCSGKYKDIKAQARAEGGKFTSYVYAMIVDCDQIETGTIVKVAMSGSSVSPWIELKQKGGAKDGIKATGYTDQSNGGIKFRSPVFESFELEDAENEEAELAYEQVKAYFANAPHTTDDRVPDYVVDASEDQVPSDDLPF